MACSVHTDSSAAAELPAALTPVFSQLKAITPLICVAVQATGLSTTQPCKYFTIKSLILTNDEILSKETLSEGYVLKFKQERLC